MDPLKAETRLVRIQFERLVGSQEGVDPDRRKNRKLVNRVKALRNLLEDLVDDLKEDKAVSTVRPIIEVYEEAKQEAQEAEKLQKDILNWLNRIDPNRPASPANTESEESSRPEMDAEEALEIVHDTLVAINEIGERPRHTQGTVETPEIEVQPQTNGAGQGAAANVPEMTAKTPEPEKPKEKGERRKNVRSNHEANPESASGSEHSDEVIEATPMANNTSSRSRADILPKSTTEPPPYPGPGIEQPPPYEAATERPNENGTRPETATEAEPTEPNFTPAERRSLDLLEERRRQEHEARWRLTREATELRRSLQRLNEVEKYLDEMDGRTNTIMTKLWKKVTKSHEDLAKDLQSLRTTADTDIRTVDKRVTDLNTRVTEGYEREARASREYEEKVRQLDAEMVEIRQDLSTMEERRRKTDESVDFIRKWVAANLDNSKVEIRKEVDIAVNNLRAYIDEVQKDMTRHQSTRTDSRVWWEEDQDREVEGGAWGRGGRSSTRTVKEDEVPSRENGSKGEPTKQSRRQPQMSFNYTTGERSRPSRSDQVAGLENVYDILDNRNVSNNRRRSDYQQTWEGGARGNDNPNRRRDARNGRIEVNHQENILSSNHINWSRLPTPARANTPNQHQIPNVPITPRNIIPPSAYARGGGDHPSDSDGSRRGGGRRRNGRREGDWGAGRRQRRGGPPDDSPSDSSSYSESSESPEESSDGHRRHRHGRRRRGGYREGGRRRAEGDPNLYPPDQWWRDSFNHPWNIPPKRRDDKDNSLNTFLKNNSLEKFKGDQSTYFGWREIAIACVHTAPMDIKKKMSAMSLIIDTKHPSMKDVWPAQECWTAESYARLIRKLEEKYGGEQRVVALMKEKLEELKVLRKDNVDDISLFINRVGDFTTTMDRYDQPQEYQTNSFYTQLWSLMPSDYVDQYYAMLRVQGRPQGVNSLIDWCHLKLTDLRMKQEQEAMASSYRRPTGSITPKVNTLITQYDGNDSLFDEEDEEILCLATQLACSVCKGPHLMVKCQKYKEMTIEERRKIIVENGHCYNCLDTRHTARNCPKESRCKFCKGKHHHTLHRAKETGNTEVTETKVTHIDISTIDFDDQEEGEGKETSSTCLKSTEEDTRSYLKRPRIGFPAVPAYLSNPLNPDRRMRVIIVQDSADQRTLIKQECKDVLGLEGRTSTFAINAANNVVSTFQSTEAWVTLESEDGSTKLDIRVRCTPNPVGDWVPVNWNEQKEKWVHLRTINFPDIQEEKCHVLLGQDYAFLMSALQADIEGNPGEPIARKTRLGWVAMGLTAPAPKAFRNLRLKEYREQEASTLMENKEHIYVFGVTSAEEIDDLEISDLLKAMWETESTPTDEELVKSKQHRFCMAQLKKSFKRQDGRMVASCLWRPNEPKLSNNYVLARSRWMSFEKSVKSQPTVKNWFDDVIASWLEKGYVRRVPEVEQRPKIAYYLPIFAVVKPDRDTTKLRIVVDARVPFNNKSLNDCIYPGPNRINDLTEVLLRFRLNNIGLIGDISEMFLQLILSPEDRKYHRFLYRKSEEEELGEYEFLVHSFGNAGSPAVAVHALFEAAKEMATEYPRAAECVLKSTLIDDHLDSVNTTEEALELYEGIKAISASLKMNVRKFCSNSKTVMASIPEEDRGKGHEILGDNDVLLPLTKTLGIVWDPEADLFSFKEGLAAPGPWDKKHILRTYARVFDPLGFVVAWVVSARILFQKCWRDGLDWKDELGEEKTKTWKAWMEGLTSLNQVKIPRCLRPVPEGSVVEDYQVHIFADASKDAYCAVAYFRTSYKDREPEIRFVMARAKVGPTKPVTIPRMELMAAVLAVKISGIISNALKLKQDQIRFWSDSRNVLAWLRTDEKDLLQFVANRIDKIQKQSNRDSWRWVPTAVNAADHGSRGVAMDQLLSLEQWWSGPAFLRRPPEEWPEEQDVEMTEEGLVELKKTATVLKTMEVPPKVQEALSKQVLEEEEVETLHRPPLLTTWLKNVRSLAWLCCWKRKMLERLRAKKPLRFKNADTYRVKGTPADKKVVIKNAELEPQDLEEGETALIRYIQAKGFAHEILSLRRTGHVLKSSKLSKLGPKMDKHGVLRLAGLLRGATHIKFEKRCPVILPKNNVFVRLLMRHYHEYVNKHMGGPNHLFSEVGR